MAVVDILEWHRSPPMHCNQRVVGVSMLEGVVCMTSRWFSCEW